LETILEPLNRLLCEGPISDPVPSGAIPVARFIGKSAFQFGTSCFWNRPFDAKKIMLSEAERFLRGKN
jgi:hypothetical protein